MVRLVSPRELTLGHPRATGTVLLELVLLLLVVVAGLAQRAVSGDPLPMTAAPPAVGSCLRQSTEGVEATPCSEPHALQVTRSWPVWLWDDRGVNGTAAVELCRLAATKFLGSAARFQDWGPIPLRALSVLTGGPGRDHQPWGWQACAVTAQVGQGFPTTGAGQSGSLAGAAAMNARPAELRSCFDVVGLGWTATSCSEPHAGEFLAERPVPATGERSAARSRADLLASCRTAAPWLIGRSLDGDDRVRLTVRNGGVGSDDTAPVTPTAAGAALPREITVRCAIESIAGYYLRGSVIGLGHRPLPLR